MNEAYEKSLLMIKLLGIKLTRKQYNQLAVRFNLLSADTLQYISQNNFDFLVRKTISSERGFFFWKIFIKLPKCNKIHDIYKIEHTKDKVILWK